MSQKYEKLKCLLMELFQLDQPELDFGVYRILHARRAEITKFLEQDLLPQVKEALAEYKPADKAALEKELAEAIAQAKDLGADPETLPKVQELRARLAEDVVDLDALEAEVYDHLYRFFRRYYDEGDFISRRVYKEGVYAIPYEGEEVKLHWANADQYYIKTSEYLRNYAFCLRPDDEQNPMRVRFQLVDAAEGEHGNVKETNGRERRFKLAPEPFAAVEDGELVIRFTFQPDPEKRKQKDLNGETEAAILGLTDPALADWIAALRRNYVRADGTLSDNSTLRVHLDRYTACNTFDYFIHKDLGGFLRRELDFYIKNEVMHLDDIESESAPRVEQYLSKIKVIRKIAHKIIDFLAQLEDFQKKLWLKKKFVTETSWCIRLGVIPEKFYPEIAANDAQREEWVRLCAIDELKPGGGDLFEEGAPGYSEPLTAEFLKAHPTLMVDTRHFDVDFTARLLAAIGDVDEQTDGVLFHSENFQALSLMQERYLEQLKCIYIDPPYNTGKGDFVYKDGYQHSSWLSMLEDRGVLARDLLNNEGVFVSSIGDGELDRYRLLLANVFGSNNFLANFVWNNEGNIDNQSKVKVNHEYLLAFCKDKRRYPHPLVIAPDIEKGSKLFNDTIENSITKNGPANPPSEVRLPEGFPAAFEEGVIAPRGDKWPHILDPIEVKGGKVTRPARLFSGWSSRTLLDKFIANNYAPVKDSKGLDTWFKVTDTGAIYVYKKREQQSHVLSVIRNVGTVKKMAGFLSDMGFTFSYPKPIKLIQYVCRFTNDPGALICDHFAGSGTTGHAVINLNREDGGRRKFILVEQADYFDTVLLPRLKKVTFSPEWKDGKPKRLATPEEAERSPRMFKVVRLESYEDTLNNLQLKRTQAQQSLLDLAEAQGPDRLREQYILRYMLDVETRGSQSLLNVAAFTDPTAYLLKIKPPGSDESREVCVDLIETFNWLIGLVVEHIAAPQTFAAEFERDSEGRLRLKGRLRQEADGPWWFRTVIGTTRDGRKTLVIWRKRPGGEEPEGIEQDNLVLDEWFTKQGYSSKDSEFDLIYVNGDNNLENLKAPDETWKVRLIEEDFLRLMFDTERV
ncbi:site-specific DNA-methyltransferase [Deferrisoma palaeochoriense]